MNNAGRELVITRVFDAPRELVWQAWTDARHVVNWWGPDGFTNPVCEVDARPGGLLHIDMRGPDGTLYRGGGVFREVVEPEKLVFLSTALDEHGNTQLEVLHTVTFAEQNGRTKLTLHAAVIHAEPGTEFYLEGMEHGWNQSLNHLADELDRMQNRPVHDGPLPPSDALRRLDVLVGTWELSGETQGQVRYEWMDGGYFLLQHVNLEYNGHQNKGMEVIGHERPFNVNTPSEDIKSRFYSSTGETLDYVYELEGDTLTIWGGAKGSPAYYRGTFSADRNTLTGAWAWPGGGYTSNMTRVK
jgi:uncharacterized protein YndB with AHSA1/START domain